jgi:hypothetical protein
MILISQIPIFSNVLGLNILLIAALKLKKSSTLKPIGQFEVRNFYRGNTGALSKMATSRI